MAHKRNLPKKEKHFLNDMIRRYFNEQQMRRQGVMKSKSK